MGTLFPDSPEYPDFVPCLGYCEECVASAKALMLGVLVTASIAGPLLHREPMRLDDAPHHDHSPTTPLRTLSGAVSSSTGSNHVITPKTGELTMTGNPVEWSIGIIS